MQPDITAQHPSNGFSRGRIKAPAVALVVDGLLSSLVSGGCLIYFLKVRADPQMNVGLANMSKHVPMLFPTDLFFENAVEPIVDASRGSVFRMKLY